MLPRVPPKEGERSQVASIKACENETADGVENTVGSEPENQCVTMFARERDAESAAAFADASATALAPSSTARNASL